MEDKFFSDLFYHIGSKKTVDITKDEDIVLDIYCKYYSDKLIWTRTPGFLDVIARLAVKYRFHFDS